VTVPRSPLATTVAAHSRCLCQEQAVFTTPRKTNVSQP
jgi:hypothetical protein